MYVLDKIISLLLMKYIIVSSLYHKIESIATAKPYHMYKYSYISYAYALIFFIYEKYKETKQ